MDKHQLEAMVEPLARLLAAEAMAMVKDPYGENLPEDLWRLKVPAARDFLGLEVDTPVKGAILRAQARGQEMQDWDWDYFAGRDIEYPQGRPGRRPFMSKNATPSELRKYADELEAYESDQTEFDHKLREYNKAVVARQEEFRAELRATGDFTDEQFDLLWSEAWERGHSAGLSEVAYCFDELHGLVLAWDASKK